MKETLETPEKNVSPGIRQWKRDLIYGISFLVFAIGNIIYAGKLKPGSIKLKAAQAGTYLTAVMILLAVLGICIAVRAVVKKPDTICEPLFNRVTWVTLSIVGGYLLILDKAGFVISSFLFVFILTTYYSVEQGKVTMSKGNFLKAIVPFAVCAAITTAVCYFLFGKVLTVVLPRFTLF